MQIIGMPQNFTFSNLWLSLVKIVHI